MITFNDVDLVLKYHSASSLSKNYEARQLRENAINNSKAQVLLNKLSIPSFFYPANEADYLISMVAAQIADDPQKKDFFKQFLEQNNYQVSYELLASMRLVDLFSTHAINMDCIELLCNFFLTIDSLRKDGCFIATFLNEKSCEFKDALSQLHMNVPPLKRRGSCHMMTKMGMIHRPSLVGAYYYIPFQFAGHLEHSVLIDQEQNIVYDLAQNIALPLEIWQSYYEQPSFTILGEEFLEIYSKVLEKYHYPISMTTIEEVKRVLKK